jgi:CspA family cold shock protein
MTGCIVTVNFSKGFAFILPDGCEPFAGHNHFAHKSDFAGAEFFGVKRGDRVAFDSAHGPRGLRAENVRRLDPAAGSCDALSGDAAGS